MSLTLCAPGTRKGNRYWMVRGRHDGRLYEVSTKTADKAAARQFLRELERELAGGRLPRAGDGVSFAQAAQLYAAFRGLDLANPRAHHGRDRTDASGIARLVGELGKIPLAEINHARLVAAANRLYPDRTAATRNREAMRPAAAILHYAAKSGLCAWLRVELFREPRAKTRAVTLDVAGQLVGAAPQGPRRLLLVWLFRQGTRISDTLRVRWEDIDLTRMTVRVHEKKPDVYITLPLHPEVLEMLAAVPQAERAGRLFPTWTQKTAVYRWLRPLAGELGITFTPHMARHSLGTWLNEGGAGLRTIMAALGHADAKSSLRYQTADIEIVRAAAAGFAPITRRAANG